MKQLFTILILLAATSAFAQILPTSIGVNPQRIGKYQKRLEYLMYNGDKIAAGDTLYFKDEYYGTIKNISKYVKSETPYYYAALDNGKKIFSIDLTAELDNNNLTHQSINSPREGFDMERIIPVNATAKAGVFSLAEAAIPRAFSDGNYAIQGEDNESGEILVKGILSMSDKPAAYLKEERQVKITLTITARDNKCRAVITDVIFETRTPDHPAWTAFSFTDLFTQTEKGINTKWAKETIADVNVTLSKFAAQLEQQIARN